MIRHIIFDMDGTLADSAKAVIPACAQVSKKFGLPPVSDEAVKQAVGCGGPEFYFHLYPHKPKRLMLEYAQEADKLTEMIVWELGADILLPDVMTMLESLMLRRVGLYVVSAASFSYVNAVLTTAGVQHFFDAIAFGETNQTDAVGKMIYGDRSRWALVGTLGLSAARENGIAAMAAGFGYISRRNAAMFDRALRTPGSVVSWLH